MSQSMLQSAPNAAATYSNASGICSMALDHSSSGHVLEGSCDRVAGKQVEIAGLTHHTPLIRTRYSPPNRVTVEPDTPPRHAKSATSSTRCQVCRVCHYIIVVEALRHAPTRSDMSEPLWYTPSQPTYLTHSPQPLVIHTEKACHVDLYRDTPKLTLTHTYASGACHAHQPPVCFRSKSFGSYDTPSSSSPYWRSVMRDTAALNSASVPR